MGVNMLIDIEGWDEFVNGGMKQIFRDAAAFPRVYRSDDPDVTDIRPSDFARWRAGILALDCNVEMRMKGLDALEANPDLWIQVSY